MESMKFREDNSHQLRKELKQESKAVYGLVKSILSMDHNADLYNGTASTFYPLGEEMYAQLLEDLRAAKKFIFIEFYIIDEGLMWNSILEILEQKVKEGGWGQTPLWRYRLYGDFGWELYQTLEKDGDWCP